MVSLSLLDLAISSAGGMSALRSLRILKAFRVLRLLKMFRYLQSLRKIGEVLLTSFTSFAAIALLIVLFWCVGCVLLRVTAIYCAFIWCDVKALWELLLACVWLRSVVALSWRQRAHGVRFGLCSAGACLLDRCISSFLMVTPVVSMYDLYVICRLWNQRVISM